MKNFATRILLLACLVTAPIEVRGQGGNNQGGNNQGGGFPGGITINPGGLIASPMSQRINPALEQRRLKALAQQNLPSEVNHPSELRKVSLVRLEQECLEAIENGRNIPDHVKYLSGITQIHYLFALPETGDVVLAGPAEGFAPLQDGRMVGVETGRPVLTLDDLLVMLRLDNMNTTLGCSFDPEPARLANAQAWNRANSSPASPAVARQRFHQMAQVLGNWNITIFGLPAASHAAITTVEADYELKRLTLGLYKPGIRGFLSHLDTVQPGGNSMRRWWFAPLYNVIERSADGNAFHISGPRLQLLSQDELVDVQGNRSDAAFTTVSAERYTKQFNKHIEALCQRIPSFAGIQNLFDLAVVAALIRSNRLEEAVGWKPSLLLNAQRLPIAEYSVPTEVPSMANVKSANRGLLLGLIGGGVTIVPNRVVSRTDVLDEKDRPAAAPKATGKTDFWWD